MRTSPHLTPPARRRYGSIALVSSGSGAGSFGVTPPDLLLAPLGEHDDAGERHFDAQSAARFIGGERLGQNFAEERRERSGVFYGEALEVSDAAPFASSRF